MRLCQRCVLHVALRCCRHEPIQLHSLGSAHTQCGARVGKQCKLFALCAQINLQLKQYVTCQSTPGTELVPSHYINQKLMIFFLFCSVLVLTHLYGSTLTRRWHCCRRGLCADVFSRANQDSSRGQCPHLIWANAGLFGNSAQADQVTYFTGYYMPQILPRPKQINARLRRSMLYERTRINKVNFTNTYKAMYTALGETRLASAQVVRFFNLPVLRPTLNNFTANADRVFFFNLLAETNARCERLPHCQQ